MTNTSKPTVEQIKKWERVQKRIAELQKAEKEMRQAIVEGYFADREEGTNNKVIEGLDGQILKCVQKVTYSINEDDFQKIIDDKNAPELPLDRLVKTKHSLSLAEYDRLTPEQFAYFNQCVTSKLALPTLTIAEDK